MRTDGSLETARRDSARDPRVSGMSRVKRRLPRRLMHGSYSCPSEPSPSVRLGGLGNTQSTSYPQAPAPPQSRLWDAKACTCDFGIPQVVHNGTGRVVMGILRFAPFPGRGQRRPLAGLLRENPCGCGNEAASPGFFPRCGGGYPQNSPQPIGQRFFCGLPVETGVETRTPTKTRRTVRDGTDASVTRRGCAGPISE